jgi:hypothetical protein
MFLIISDIIFITTFIVAFLVCWRSKKNKIFLEIAPISNILLIGALFDILILIFQDHNSSRVLGIFYWLVFPTTIIFSKKIIKLETTIVVSSILLLSLILIRFIDYDFLKNYLNYITYPLILVIIISIIHTTENCFSYKRRLKTINYFYYLILGFMVIELFFFLCYYQIIIFNFSVWSIFLYFFFIYLNILRIIYIVYVAKNL